MGCEPTTSGLKRVGALPTELSSPILKVSIFVNIFVRGCSTMLERPLLVTLYTQKPYNRVTPKIRNNLERGSQGTTLKAVDTIGNCHSLAFTVGVSQHMHKITNL